MSQPRPPIIHVVLMDGTFASLADGRRSSIGRIHRLLAGQFGLPWPPGRLRLHYGMGQQWNRWRTLPDLASGRALEMRIIDAYGWLASAWRPGDQIFMFGYSRGAFAVRSLAGMIDYIGLLRPEAATERHIRLAWRLYQQGGSATSFKAFRRRCHPAAPIRMLGCFDTVMALGVRLPLLWMLTEPRFRFHNAHLGRGIEHGVQALALDETRAVFAPLLWDDDHAAGRVRQMWFRGSHPDIGGQLSGFGPARPLANIPLVWMLGQAEELGLPLPQGWRTLFPQNPAAPSLGSWRGWGKLFLARAPRLAGRFETESLHPTVPLPYPGPALLTGDLAPAAGRPLRRRSVLGRRAPAGPPDGPAA